MPDWASERVKATPAFTMASSPPARSTSAAAVRASRMAATVIGRNWARTPGSKSSQNGSRSNASLSIGASWIRERSVGRHVVFERDGHGLLQRRVFRRLERERRLDAAGTGDRLLRLRQVDLVYREQE